MSRNFFVFTKGLCSKPIGVKFEGIRFDLTKKETKVNQRSSMRRCTNVITFGVPCLVFFLTIG
jgi:uncharacterized membrane protein